MSEEIKKKTVQELILEEIKSGKTRMRPRWYFILQATLVSVGLIIVALILLYIGSFIFFILGEDGVWYLPGFGLMGIEMFLSSLPWILIITGVIFLILLEVLVRHYSFGYRKPLLYSLVIIVIFAGIASLIVSATSFHNSYRSRDTIKSLPIIGQLYLEYEERKYKDARIGVIIEITGEGFIMEDYRNDRLSIVVNSETSFPLGVDFHNGDRVIVLGDESDNDGIITALGVRKVSGSGQSYPRDKGWYRPMIATPMPQ